MINTILHRGPDGVSVTGERDHAFGHARLAIIDLVTGVQPMLSRSGRWLIAFNGEIYNYRALRERFQSRYEFSTRSDTETILAAVECLGLEEGLAHIDGMYAIALFDRQERRLHLARDHFGIKPLYWTRLAGGGVAFASEMRAFVPLSVPMNVDRTAVLTQLLCRFIPAPWTGREGINKLRPGELRSFEVDGSEAGPVRRIRPIARNTATSMVDVHAMAHLAEEAVRSQTVSDVPIGMLLSGGVDSALVAQFAARANPNLHSYCVGYGENDRATEFGEASETAALIGTSHQNITVQRDDFAASIRHAMRHLEEPVATTSLVTYSLLCKAVAAQRKVVLSGQGADEPWAGYSRHRFEALLQTHGTAMRALAPMAAVIDAKRARLGEILRYQNDETRRWIAYRSLFPQARLRQVFGPAMFDAAIGRIDAALTWADQQAPEALGTAFSRLLVRDSYTDLSDNLLLLSDKLSMAWGLEVRVPMLDVAYATQVMRLPLSAKRDGLLMARGKAMHKDVAVLTLPQAVVDRPKKGFETPLQRWFAGDFGRQVRDLVFSSSAPLASHVCAADLFVGKPEMQTVSYELQQQLFSLWLANEWIETSH